MGVREDIKAIVAQENWTLTEVAAELGKKLNKKYTQDNLSSKLYRKTLRYEEAVLIGDILGYDLKFEKRKG